MQTMKMLQLPEEDMALLTGDKAAARIHVTFMGAALQPEKLAERMRAAGVKHIVGFRPTGGRCGLPARLCSAWLWQGRCMPRRQQSICCAGSANCAVLRVHACVPISRLHCVTLHSF